MLLSELTIKDVISEKDGAKMGKITDLEIDTMTGRILSVKVQLGFKFVNLFSNKDITNIPWQKILKIGNDVIIVDQSLPELPVAK